MRNCRETFLDTLILFLIVHAYGVMNYLPSHDGVMVVARDGAWQLSLGRFAQFFYQKLRGEVAAPWLIFLLAYVFFSLSFYLMLELLKIRSRVIRLLIIGIMTSSLTFLVDISVFLYMMDSYGLAMLLAVGGVWLMEKCSKWQRIPAAALLFLWSMGLYQCFMAVAASLCLLLLMQKVMEKKPQRELGRTLLVYLFSAGLGAAGYLAVVHLSSALSGIPLSGTYNSISNLTTAADGGSRGLGSYLALIPEMYRTFFRYYMEETGFNTLPVRCIYILLILLGLWSYMRWLRRHKPGAVCTAELLLGLLLAPAAMNCIYILTGGMVHILMVESYHMVLLFLFLPVLDRQPVIRGSIIRTEQTEPTGKNTEERPRAATENLNMSKQVFWRKIFPCLSAAALVLLLLIHAIIYDNGYYYYRKIVGDASQYRIYTLLQDLERDPDYVPGETPVALVGEFLASSMNFGRHDYSQYETIPYNFGSSVTYYLSFTEYANFLAGEDILLTDSSEYAESDAVKAMPCYPKEGYLQMRDGVMIVKLSDYIAESGTE